jgi:hypothetical protein
LGQIWVKISDTAMTSTYKLVRGTSGRRLRTHSQRLATFCRICGLEAQVCRCARAPVAAPPATPPAARPPQPGRGAAEIAAMVRYFAAVPTLCARCGVSPCDCAPAPPDVLGAAVRVQQQVTEAREKGWRK